MSAHRRRLERLGLGLTPTQIVLRWLEEALQCPSMPQFVASLCDQPESAWPLHRLPSEAEQAVRAAAKGKPRETVHAAVREAVRDVVFLYGLQQGLNLKVASELESLRGRLAYLLAELSRVLVMHDQRHHQASAWLQLCTELPYPLDPDTAKAVRAAITCRVESWTGLREVGIIEEWVAAQQGSEPRAGAEDEARFARRVRRVESALRGLVRAGVVQAGWILQLETVPLLFLQEVPVVAGRWVDRYVVELAEYGALLQREGFGCSATDDHPLAWERPGREAAEEQGGRQELDAETAHDLGESARANLDRCAGPATELDGRRYLDVRAYGRWRGRHLRGSVRRRMQPGFEVASWNAWVEAGDGSNVAALAGVPVAALEPWVSSATLTVHPPAEVAVRQRRRQRILDALRPWAWPSQAEAGESQGQDPVVTHATTWGARAAETLTALRALRLATARIQQDYFKARPALWGEIADELQRQAAGLEEAVGIFNAQLAEPLDRTAERRRALGLGTDTEPEQETLGLDPAGPEGDAVAAAQRLVSLQVDLAKAEALSFIGDSDGARAFLLRCLPGLVA